jgi:hypothetical protein
LAFFFPQKIEGVWLFLLLKGAKLQNAAPRICADVYDRIFVLINTDYSTSKDAIGAPVI